MKFVKTALERIAGALEGLGSDPSNNRVWGVWHF